MVTQHIGQDRWVGTRYPVTVPRSPVDNVIWMSRAEALNHGHDRTTATFNNLGQDGPALDSARACNGGGYERGVGLGQGHPIGLAPCMGDPVATWCNCTFHCDAARVVQPVIYICRSKAVSASCQERTRAVACSQFGKIRLMNSAHAKWTRTASGTHLATLSI